MSTGAEIETALCILESAPYVRIEALGLGISYYIRNQGICGGPTSAKDVVWLTFSHLTITVLLLLRARHVHVRRHSMHIFA